MKTIYHTDIFQLPQCGDALCVTTNGCVKRNGQAVMGKGIAKTANERFHVALKLGCLLGEEGNHVHSLGIHTEREYRVFSFPTKDDWRKPSDLKLIEQSARELVCECNALGLRNGYKCYLTPPGCGCGGLDYHTQVDPLLRNILDDRFVVVIRP